MLETRSVILQIKNILLSCCLSADSLCRFAGCCCSVVSSGGRLFLLVSNRLISRLADWFASVAACLCIYNSVLNVKIAETHR